MELDDVPCAIASMDGRENQLFVQALRALDDPQEFRERLQTELYQQDGVVKTKGADGSVVYLELCWKGPIVVVNNVTEGELAKERVRLVLEASFDGFWDWYIQDDYEYMSPGFWRMFGYNPGEKQHKPSEWQELVFQEDLPKVLACFNEHVASRGEKPFFSEVRYRHKDGRTIWVYCKGHVVEWTEDGAPVRMIGTHTEITQSKLSKLRIEALEKDVLAERARAETENALNEYIAHEVRNPLSVAIICTRFVMSVLESYQPCGCSCESSSGGGAVFEKGKKNSIMKDLEMIQSSQDYIMDLLSNLLELNKFSKKGIVLEKQLVSITDDVVRPCVAMFQRSESGTELTMKCTENTWVKTDAVRLKQVLVNLIKNSVKFVQSGFIRVSVYRAPFDPELLTISVEDSGPGIDANVELFSKYSSGLENNFQGTGIGLNLCKTIVAAMKGRIWHDKEYDSGVPDQPGARLVVELPLPEEPGPEDGVLGSTCRSGIGSPRGRVSAGSTASEKSSIQAIEFLYRKCTCLVVDDDPVIRMTLVRQLRKVLVESTFLQASSGEAAVRMVEENPQISVIFVDHYMPGPGTPLTGPETIRKIRNIDAERGLQNIIVGLSANNKETEFKTAGADLFIRKPWGSGTEIEDLLVRSVMPPAGVNVLVVDEDAMSRAVFTRLMLQLIDGWTADECGTMEEAMKKLNQNKYQLVVTSMNIGKEGSGTELASYVRKNYGHTVRTMLVSALVSQAMVKDSGTFHCQMPKPIPRNNVFKGMLIKLFRRTANNVDLPAPELPTISKANALEVPHEAQVRKIAVNDDK